MSDETATQDQEAHWKARRGDSLARAERWRSRYQPSDGSGLVSDHAGRSPRDSGTSFGGRP